MSRSARAQGAAKPNGSSEAKRLSAMALALWTAVMIMWVSAAPLGAFEAIQDPWQLYMNSASRAVLG